MELSLGVIIIGLVLLFIFRKPMRKISNAVDSELTSVLLENDVENIISTNEAISELRAELGDNFMTVEEAYRQLHKRSRKTQPQQS